jgi:hypothetical protein
MLLATVADDMLSEYSMEGRKGKRTFSALSLTPFIEGKSSGRNNNYERESAIFFAHLVMMGEGGPVGLLHLLPAGIQKTTKNNLIIIALPYITYISNAFYKVTLARERSY